MTLVLALLNHDSLTNGAPTSLSLDRRGAVLGRSPTVEWCLPDPACVISSRHCEISYRGDGYVLSDVSTNGTLVNGAPATPQYVLRHGDRLTIGHYEIGATLSGGGAQAPSAAAAAPTGNWGGWDSHLSTDPVGVNPSEWDRKPAAPVISGVGPLSARIDQSASFAPGPSEGWGPPPAAVPSPVAPVEAVSWSAPGNAAGESPWTTGPEPAATPASPWSSAAGTAPAPATADDIWGRLAEVNTVDWSRSGFGVAPPAPPAADPLGLQRQSAGLGLPPPPAPAPVSLPQAPPPVPSPQPIVATAPVPAPIPPAAVPAPADDGLRHLLQAAGLAPDAIKSADADGLDAAGRLLRGLVAGMVVMLEARARAKAQMGAQSTSLEFDGNNPLKFARSPEGALVQLLNPAERGFMNSERAVEDAFFDLQSHQMATLKAMQGALKATLDRFSPTAIKARTEAGGLLAQIMPGARDAALWRAYEKEFGGVAQGSDEAFMDVFAKEFRNAYEEQAAKRPRR